MSTERRFLITVTRTYRVTAEDPASAAYFWRSMLSSADDPDTEDIQIEELPDSDEWGV